MLEYNRNIENLMPSENGGANWPWKIFIFTIIIFGTVLGSYFGLILGYRPYLDSRIAAVQGDIDALSASVSLEDQQKFLKFYSQIVNLRGLLASHIAVDNFLAFLEKNTNKRVNYEIAALDIKHRELTLEGVTDSFATLSEQLVAIGQAPEVASYTLNQSQLTAGKTRFRSVLTLKPEVFKS